MNCDEINKVKIFCAVFYFVSSNLITYLNVMFTLLVLNLCSLTIELYKKTICCCVLFYKLKLCYVQQINTIFFSRINVDVLVND